MARFITEPDRFGGFELLANKEEMGHLHGERLADLPFPIEVRTELLASGRTLPHHIYPESGGVSYWTRNSDDIPAVINLFEMQYDRLSENVVYVLLSIVKKFCFAGQILN